MDKKTYLLVLGLLTATSFQPVFAEYKSSVALRGAAFIPTSDRFRDIYGDAGPNYQIEGCIKVARHLDYWVNIDGFMKHGRSDHGHNPTRINIANLSLGLKFPYRINNILTLYIGIGPTFGIVWLKNRSACLHQNIARPAFGGTIKSGIYCFLSKHIFLDLFADFVYQPAIFPRTVNIGGVKAGGGIGYKF